MREIKFRAWVHRDGIMVKVIGFDFGPSNPTVQWYDGMHDALSGTITDEFLERTEVMQYTGLKDKNGKEIYEGDILYCHGNLDENTEYLIGAVYFDEDIAAFVIKNDEAAPFIPNDEVFVKGNIYEHPHLAEGLRSTESAQGVSPEAES